MAKAGEHFTFVALRTETDGSLLGTPFCEVCGRIAPPRYLDEAGSELEQIAAEHWVNSPTVTGPEHPDQHRSEHDDRRDAEDH